MITPFRVVFFCLKKKKTVSAVLLGSLLETWILWYKRITHCRNVFMYRDMIVLFPSPSEYRKECVKPKKAQGFSIFGVTAVYTSHSHHFASNLHRVQLLNLSSSLKVSLRPVAVDHSCRISLGNNVHFLWSGEIVQHWALTRLLLAVFHLYNLQQGEGIDIINCE